jgi:hypothetical protein
VRYPVGAIMMLEELDLTTLHDQSLVDWYANAPDTVEASLDLESVIRAHHFCNFTLWGLEDQARRRDVDDSVIAGVKRAIDRCNQRRNDLVERIDECVLDALPASAPTSAEQHSETAGQMIDRLSILSLKIWHMRRNAGRKDDAALAAECAAKLEVLEAQRRDLAACLRRLIDECRAGRRFFRLYRQFKQYNDPRLNPALREE